MILDSFKNAGRYPQILYLKEIEQYLQSQDYLKTLDIFSQGAGKSSSVAASFPSGAEHEILGRDLFVRIAEYPTTSGAEKKFEAHQVYADLQLVVEGRERMGFSPEARPEPVTAYDAKADIRFFNISNGETPLLVSAGQFTVFFPGELHRPGCHPGQVPENVKKLVFKIKMGRPS